METVEFRCPQCGSPAVVRQIQGDRCPGCSFEFKWYAPTEEENAEDYHQALSGRRHLLPLAPGQGVIVAHE
jgi:ribosomal protein L37AE/L43A